MFSKVEKGIFVSNLFLINYVPKSNTVRSLQMINSLFCLSTLNIYVTFKSQSLSKYYWIEQFFKFFTSHLVPRNEILWVPLSNWTHLLQKELEDLTVNHKCKWTVKQIFWSGAGSLPGSADAACWSNLRQSRCRQKSADSGNKFRRFKGKFYLYTQRKNQKNKKAW